MFERVISVILALSALVVAGVLVTREVTDGRGRLDGAGAPELYLQPEWEELLQSGRMIGAPDAPVQIVEFVDFECPACKHYHTQLKEVAREFEGRVAMTLVHFPLHQHRHAYETARAAECAHAQGRFAEFVDVVFAGQEQIGAKAWTAFAADAGAIETGSFEECMNGTEALMMVDKGLELGKRIGVRGTPSILINGFRYSLPPTRPQLLSVVGRIAMAQEN